MILDRIEEHERGKIFHFGFTSNDSLYVLTKILKDTSKPLVEKSRKELKDSVKLLKKVIVGYESYQELFKTNIIKFKNEEEEDYFNTLVKLLRIYKNRNEKDTIKDVKKAIVFLNEIILKDENPVEEIEFKINWIKGFLRMISNCYASAFGSTSRGCF